jgi:hypothetical protein
MVEAELLRKGGVEREPQEQVLGDGVTVFTLCPS